MPTETVQQFSDFGRVIERRVPQLVLVVPYDGEKIVFTLRAETFSHSPPRVAVLTDNELRITVDGPAGSAASVRARFDEQLDRIDECLAWSRKQVEQHNAQIRADAPGLVARRRAELLATRNLQAEIGYPIRRRPDADTYSVPIRRRKLRPVQPTRAAAPFKPEPVMADSDYEAAVAVLRNSRNALERTPSLASKLDEEQIRDMLLVNLNAHFEGAAAGEVFNGYGKTDILIRVGDRNIFIGECKIWGGAQHDGRGVRADLQVPGLARHQSRDPAVHP